MPNPQSSSDLPAPLRHDQFGDGTPLVVLYCAAPEERASLEKIARDVSVDATVILIDQAPGSHHDGVDATAEAARIIRLLDEQPLESPEQRPLVLVGWAKGTPVIAALASKLSTGATAVVLIDPEPATIPPDSPVQIDRYPVTVILPGIRPGPNDTAARLRRERQEVELSRLPSRREIIAGRSRDNVPLERPDVVIEAIRSSLGDDDQTR